MKLATTEMTTKCAQCGEDALCIYADSAWICVKCRKPPAPPPVREPRVQVKYLNDNIFLLELEALYGDLPLDELIERWKHDNPEKPKRKR